METDKSGHSSETAAEIPAAAAGRSVTAWCAVAGALFLLLDQATKLWILHAYQLHESTPVIPDIFSITYVRNPGAAWGIFAGRGWLLLTVAAVVVVLMIRFFNSLCAGYAERKLALFLIFSGVFGNSIDRIWHGSVIDFIDFHYKNVWSYPVFNVADIAICVGVGLFLLSDLLRPDRKKEK